MSNFTHYIFSSNFVDEPRELQISEANNSRGTWRTIRDHVQRSYLIVREAEPDQLCVPAPFFNCWPSCYTAVFCTSTTPIFVQLVKLDSLLRRWLLLGLQSVTVLLQFENLGDVGACIHVSFHVNFSWHIHLDCQFIFDRIFTSCFHFMTHCLCEDIYTNKHTRWRSIGLHQRREIFGSLLLFLSFCFARFKVLSEQMLLLNLNKCVFCNRSPTRWLQPRMEEHLYGDATTTIWPDFWIYTLTIIIRLRKKNLLVGFLLLCWHVMLEKPETKLPRPFRSSRLLEQPWNTKVLPQMSDGQRESWRNCLELGMEFHWTLKPLMSSQEETTDWNPSSHWIMTHDRVIDKTLHSVETVAFSPFFSLSFWKTYNVSTTDATPWPTTTSTTTTSDSQLHFIAETYYHFWLNTYGATTQPQWALLAIGGHSVPAGSHYTTATDVWRHPIFGGQFQHFGSTFVLEHSTFDYFSTIPRPHSSPTTGSNFSWPHTSQTTTSSTSTTTTWSSCPTFTKGPFSFHYTCGTSFPNTTQLSTGPLSVSPPPQTTPLLQTFTTSPPSSTPFTIQRQTFSHIYTPFIYKIDSTPTFCSPQHTSGRPTFMAWPWSTIRVGYSYCTRPHILQPSQFRPWTLPQGQGWPTPMPPSSWTWPTCGIGWTQHDRCWMVWKRSTTSYLWQQRPQRPPFWIWQEPDSRHGHGTSQRGHPPPTSSWTHFGQTYPHQWHQAYEVLGPLCQPWGLFSITSWISGSMLSNRPCRLQLYLDTCHPWWFCLSDFEGRDCSPLDVVFQRRSICTSIRFPRIRILWCGSRRRMARCYSLDNVGKQQRHRKTQQSPLDFGRHFGL